MDNTIKCKILGISNGKIVITNGKKTMQVTREQLREAVKSKKIVTLNLYADCINRYRDKNNNIIGYKLADIVGNTINATPEKLKNALSTHSLICTNLTLTSDNRVFYKTPEEVKNIDKPSVEMASKQPVTPVSNNKNEATTYYKLQQTDISEINKLVENDESIKTLIITGGEKAEPFIDNKNAKNLSNSELSYIKAAEKLLVFYNHHNSNIKIVNDLKFDTTAYTIIIDGLDWSEVTETKHMFSPKIDSNNMNIKIANSTAPNLSNLYCMFYDFNGTHIDLGTFSVPNITRATKMFYSCDNLTDLNIDGLKFNSTEYVGRMFGSKHNNSEDENRGPENERHARMINNAIEQIKKAGWHGYKDGRPDDFYSKNYSQAEGTEYKQDKQDRQYDEEEYYSNDLNWKHMNYLEKVLCNIA